MSDIFLFFLFKMSLKYLILVNLLLEISAMNTLNVNFYNGLTDCILNNRSILKYNNNINGDCRCLKTEVCKENLNLSKLYISYNNTKIYLNNLYFNNKCTRYNNLFYKFNIHIEPDCVYDILGIIIIVLVFFGTIILIYYCLKDISISSLKFKGLKKYNRYNYNSI